MSEARLLGDGPDAHLPADNRLAGESPDDILVVETVGRDYRLPGGGTLSAVRDVSFRLARGETLGIVGESGCGKSTLGRMVLHLTPPTTGRVLVEGETLARLSPAALRRRRRTMQMVFQDPNGSLDPRLRIGAALAEPLVIHRVGSRAERARRVEALCDLIGLPREALTRFPHEFSGGQKQRIAIARALALEPSLIVADEPVSALDVSIQAQILNLLADIRERFRLAFVFISHDLAVIRHVSDRVGVMYLGRLVELADADAFFARPAHPYARMLLDAVLEPGGAPSGAPGLAFVQGEPPNPEHPPPGCSFHPRCPLAVERCRVETPPFAETQGRMVACWRAG